jgi:hypothetical protein
VRRRYPTFTEIFLDLGDKALSPHDEQGKLSLDEPIGPHSGRYQVKGWPWANCALQAGLLVRAQVQSNIWDWAILLRFDFPLAVFLPASQLTSNGEHRMSKKASEHHKKASEHLTHAARHHGEAAKHHEAGSHEKAAHHAHVARGHVIHGRGHAEEAVKAHLEEHGKK